MPELYENDAKLRANHQHNKCTLCFESLGNFDRLCALECSKHLIHVECMVRIIEKHDFVGSKPRCTICKDFEAQNEDEAS
jgi:hypothetical protein